MKKKILFVVLAISLLILVIGGFFWWWEHREIKGSREDYVIKETPEGKFVENKKAGLKMKVPKGWKVEKVKIEKGAIDFKTSDFKADLKEGKIVLPIKKGCKIQNSIAYEKMNFSTLKIKINYSATLMGMKSINFKEITVNNYPALKTIFDKKEKGNGVGMSISIPVNNKVYGFSVVWGAEDKERCIQEFNKFLKTVSIK